MPPELTVVIPTHNRRRRLETLLRSLENQTASSDDFDVVVAVDGATDGTEEMLTAFQARYRLTVVSTAQGGAARARNQGAARATGGYLLFLDDDMIADPELVAEHLRIQRQEDGVVGLGRIDRLPRAGRLRRQREGRRRRYFDELRTRTPTFLNCYGGNLCLSREFFFAVGGFKEEIPGSDQPLGFPGHDLEFGLRLSEHGAHFKYVDAARSVEDDDATLRDERRTVGKREAAFWSLRLETHPSLLPHLHIGGAWELDVWWVGLRRLLLALRVPPALLAPLAAVIPGSGRANALLFSYSRWVGVRKVVDRDTWRRLRRGTIILMYRAVARDGEAPGRFVVSERRFRTQMAWLKRGGYTVIALDDLVRCLREYRLPPAKSVVLTFEGAYRDTLRLALPVLERFGYPWTLFLPSGAAARDGPELIEIREAASSNHGSIGARIDLGTTPRAEVEEEIIGSKAELEEALGQPVTLVSYPSGTTTEDLGQLLRDAGFEAACTITPGPNRPATDPYLLHRSEIDGRTSLLRFALILSLGDIRRRR